MQLSLNAAKCALGVGVAALLCAGAVAVCGSAQSADADETFVATYDDVITYCKACHFVNVENQYINSWDASVDAAMIESMMPMLPDETIQGLANYFAQVSAE